MRELTTLDMAYNKGFEDGAAAQLQKCLQEQKEARWEARLAAADLQIATLTAKVEELGRKGG